MADTQVRISWVGEGLRFEADHASHTPFRLDGDSKSAYSPVQALLLSLAGCMAADVVDILGKMRAPLSRLEVRVDGERNTETPRYFKAIRMRFVVAGLSQEDRPKLERAVQLSHDKYCSVLHSLRQDIQFSTELELA